MSGQNRILQLLADGAADGIFPGAVLLVCQNQRVLFFEAVGKAAIIPTPRAMTLDTNFDLASLTKPLATALTVLYLVCRKELQLDDSLTNLLPSTHIPEDKERITLRQLLCHCSGLPSWRPYYLSLEALPINIRKSRLRQQILQESLEAAPGFQTIYSDLGFLLIEWILEENTGQTLDQFTSQYLFGPMGCSSLGYLLLGQPQKSDSRSFADTERCPWRGSIISGQVHDENAYVVGGVAGHAGLFGTASEVKCVLDTILDTIASKNISVLWTREELLQFLRPARLDPSSTWALGFDTPAFADSSSGRHFSSETVGHLGFTGTSFWLDLKRRMAIILLTNRIHPNRDNEKIKMFRPLLHDAVMEEYG